jgi:hypothetical protein
MNSPEVTTAINQDVAEVKRLGVPAIPLLYVNGRWVFRWYLEVEVVLFEIFAAARFVPAAVLTGSPSAAGKTAIGDTSRWPVSLSRWCM